MACNEQLRAEGLPYPRTCADCKLGPCLINKQDTAAKAELVSLYNKNEYHKNLAAKLVTEKMSYLERIELLELQLEEARADAVFFQERRNKWQDRSSSLLTKLTQEQGLSQELFNKLDEVFQSWKTGDLNEIPLLGVEELLNKFIKSREM